MWRARGKRENPENWLLKVADNGSRGLGHLVYTLGVPLPPEVIGEHPEKAVAVSGDEQSAAEMASTAVRSRKAVRDQ